jgi:hypothetical protein
LLAVAASCLVTISGILEAVGAGGGLYWLFPAVLLALSAGLFNAWVALVEILR